MVQRNPTASKPNGSPGPASAPPRDGADGTRLSSTRLAAAYYLDQGWVPVPTPGQRGKAPTLDGWQQLTAERVRTDMDSLFPQRAVANLGLLLGDPSGALIDIDLDQPEAVIAGGLLLPPTGWISGRRSAPRSHWWYTAEGAVPATAKYQDVDRAMLVELRSTGCQTVVPPSTHYSGEAVVWHEREGRPAVLSGGELRQAVAAVAGATILARHWPAVGGRHDAALALAGGLLRAGWDAERVGGLMTAVAQAAGDDELHDRVAAVLSTATRLGAGGQATGWPTLAGLLAGQGEKVVNQVRAWLGIGDTTGRSRWGGGGRDNDGAAGSAPRSGYDIILAHFRAHYAPVFRRGNAVFSERFGREVKSSEACYGAGIELIERLARAKDAPRDGEGNVKRGGIPKFFATWSRSAWQDLLAELPSQEDAEEVSAAAAEELEGQIAAALHAQAAIGVTRYANGEEVTRTERRSLVAWCCEAEFCKLGSWTDVRGHQIWARLEPAGQRRVALRVELFSQVGPRLLAVLNQRRFSNLCRSYGFGETVHVNRDTRAVELTAAFLTGHMPVPPLGQQPSSGGATETERRRDGDAGSA